MKKFNKIMSTLLVFTLIISIALTGCSKKSSTSDGSKNSEKLTVTVGDSKIYLDEMMYYIFMNEYQLNQYDQMYKAYMGTSYWDMEYSKGVTMREFAKTSTMDMVVQYEVLYAEALKAKYELTDEEKTTIDTNVDQFMQVATKEQLEKTGLTKEIAKNVVSKLTLASRYMQDLIDGYDIDDAAITATVSKEDNRQYNTQALFISTKKTDADGKSADMSATEKADAKKKIEAFLDKAKAGDDFAKIVEGNKDVTSQDNNFVIGNGTVSEEYEKLAKDMKNDEVSAVVETADGYYIIKMVNNNSDESYQAAVKEAISAEEQKQFKANYEEIKKGYKVTINDKVWDEIVMGETTIIPEAATDSTATDATATDSATTDSTATDSSK